MSKSQCRTNLPRLRGWPGAVSAGSRSGLTAAYSDAAEDERASSIPVFASYQHDGDFEDYT